MRRMRSISTALFTRRQARPRFMRPDAMLGRDRPAEPHDDAVHGLVTWPATARRKLPCPCPRAARRCSARCRRRSGPNGTGRAPGHTRSTSAIARGAETSGIGRHRHRDVVLDAAAFGPSAPPDAASREAPEVARLRRRARDHAVCDQAAFHRLRQAAASMRVAPPFSSGCENLDQHPPGMNMQRTAAAPRRVPARRSRARCAGLMNSNALSAPRRSCPRPAGNSGSKASGRGHGDQRRPLLRGCRQRGAASPP